MDLGAPSRTYPSRALTSRAVMVVPGSRPSMTMRPASSVIYSPLEGPTTAPELSVIRKVTPSRGVVVPSMYFSITKVVLGVFSK